MVDNQLIHNRQWRWMNSSDSVHSSYKALFGRSNICGLTNTHIHVDTLYRMLSYQSRWRTARKNLSCEIRGNRHIKLLQLLAVGTIDLPDNFNTRSVVYQLFFIFSWRSVRATIKSAFLSAICQETRLAPRFSANAAPTQLQRGKTTSRIQTRMTPWYFAHADTCRIMSTTDELHRWAPIIHTESTLCWTSRKHTSTNLIPHPLSSSGHSIDSTTIPNLDEKVFDGRWVL